MSVLNALKWSFLGELASKAVQPVVFIVLARLLTPEDFGVMTAALMVIGFSQIFWEAGMGKALIQRQTDVEEAANAAFWINLVLGIIISVCLYLSASYVARTFFQDERVRAVLQVMSAQIFFGSVSAVHTALLQKKMNFKKLFWVRFSTISLPAIASIPMAYKGFEYWALVYGALLGQFVQMVMLWHISSWRPSFAFDSKVSREMVKFGAWVCATGLLTWFYAWADSLVVGHYLGSHDLGLFRTGGQLPALIFALLFGPIVPVLYSHLSRIVREVVVMKKISEITIGVLTVISMPIATLIFVYSDIIEFLIFGEKWNGIGVVLGIMALMHGLSWIVGMNGEFYRAAGNPSLETIVTAGMLIVYALVYFVAIQYGLGVFVWARMGLAVSALLFHLILLYKMFNIDLAAAIFRILMVSAVCFCVAVFVKEFSINIFVSYWSQLIFGGILSLGAVVVFVYIFIAKKIIAQVVTMVRE